jgi:hypothetical protein
MTQEPSPTVVDAEVVADLTEAEATALTKRIREWVREYPIEDVKAAFRGRVWLALGYDSWQEWCDHEFDGFHLSVPQRREVVEELHKAGMSNRAIADAVGVSRETVNRDMSSGGTNVSPGADRVTGPDGKSYPAKRDNVVPMQRRYKGRPNSKKQLAALEGCAAALSGIANGLGAVFDGEWEKTCTPEIAAEYAARFRSDITAINKVVRMLAKYGTTR